MRLTIIGDVHLSDTPPGRRNEGYYEQIMAKLTEIMATPSDAFVWIGDVFHHKAANRVPHRMVMDLLDLMDGTRPALHFFVPGNHDLADGSIESLDRQPLGVLLRDPNARLLIDPVDFNGTTLMGIPGTAAVCDAAVPLEIPGVDLCFAHAPISIENKPWATYRPADIDNMASTIIYGHQHDEAGYKDTRCWATGAISRGSVTEADHTPSFLTWQDGNISVVPIINVAPSEDVYRWGEHAAEKVDLTNMATFVASLTEARLKGFSRDALIADIHKLGTVSQNVRTAAIEILEGAS